MIDFSQIIAVFNENSISLGSIIAYAITAILGTLVALYGLGFGIQKLMLYIYNTGGQYRHVFGTLPYKGYKRFHSEKWNMEHTA